MPPLSRASGEEKLLLAYDRLVIKGNCEVEGGLAHSTGVEAISVNRDICSLRSSPVDYYRILMVCSEPTHARSYHLQYTYSHTAIFTFRVSPLHGSRLALRWFRVMYPTRPVFCSLRVDFHLTVQIKFVSGAMQC